MLIMDAIYYCNASTVNDLKKLLQLMGQVIQLYDSLINAYILEFFNLDEWKRMPLSWQAYLAEIASDKVAAPANLARFLKGLPMQSKRVMPLSLICYQRVGILFAGPRKQIHCTQLHDVRTKIGIQPRCNSSSARSAHDLNCQSMPPSETIAHGNNVGSSGKAMDWLDLNSRQLRHAFARHLKPKKRHEVGCFATLIEQLLKTDDNRVRLIDFGSGQGHLSRFLSLHSGFQVLTLEAEQLNSQQANAYDTQALDWIQRKIRTAVALTNLEYKDADSAAAAAVAHHESQSPNQVPQVKQQQQQQARLPAHLNCWVDKDNFHLLMQKVNEDANQGLNMAEGSKKIALIGLHSCGNLSSDMITLFKQNQDADYLFLCSCCYYKAEESRVPLSKFVQQMNVRIPFEFKEIACHAKENYIERLYNEMDHLKIHCFRALLEYVIDKKYPKYRHPELAKVRNYHLISFPEYAIKVTRNLDICFDPQDLDNEQTRQRLAKYMDVVIFYTLRLHLAPMLETFINLDRMIYLYEDSCISSALVPVFDATISPRNCILISKK